MVDNLQEYKMKDANSVENNLIIHCAPTLAGIKCAGLFSIRFESQDLLKHELAQLNTQLNVKGVFLKIMLVKNSFALIYTYRKTHLEKELADERVQELLLSYGYPSENTDNLLEYLKERLYTCDGFPHEIGVFLGYPIGDVKGFIENKGRDCKCSGLWKVYCNEGETQKLFAKIRKCTKVYSEVFAKGRCITQMTVCA